jgi:hypothetical protein
VFFQPCPGSIYCGLYFVAPFEPLISWYFKYFELLLDFVEEVLVHREEVLLLLLSERSGSMSNSERYRIVEGSLGSSFAHSPRQPLQDTWQKVPSCLCRLQLTCTSDSYSSNCWLLAFVRQLLRLLEFVRQLWRGS